MQTTLIPLMNIELRYRGWENVAGTAQLVINYVAIFSITTLGVVVAVLGVIRGGQGWLCSRSLRPLPGPPSQNHAFPDGGPVHHLTSPALHCSAPLLVRWKHVNIDAELDDNPSGPELRSAGPPAPSTRGYVNPINEFGDHYHQQQPQPTTSGSFQAEEHLGANSSRSSSCNCACTMSSRITKLLATATVKHCGLVAALVTSVALISLLLSLLTTTSPDFTDPTLGFETRGTVLAERLISWANLLEETRPLGSLAVNPKDILDKMLYMKNKEKNASKANVRNGKKKNKNTSAKIQKIKAVKNKIPGFNITAFGGAAGNVSDKSDVNFTSDDHEHWGYGKNLSFLSKGNKEEQIKYNRNQWISLKNLDFPSFDTDNNHGSTDGFFCGIPMPNYAHLVFKSIDDSSLMTVENLHSMCILQEELIKSGLTAYTDFCQQNEPPSQSCCAPWSLPNYVTLLSNASTCLEITEEDITSVLNLLSNCSTYFHSLKLAPDCEAEHCAAPPSCYKYNAVFNILSYIVDVNFLPPNNLTYMHVHSSMIFLPLGYSTTILPYYNNIEEKTFTHNNVTVVAMDLGVKNVVFDTWLVHDTWLIGLGGLFVIGCMWLYCGSFLLTMATCLAIAYSIIISYFLYRVVFNLNFFPFMNLLTAVVAVGIGADDMFVFVKVWNSYKDISVEGGLTSLGMNNEKLITLMTETLQHATLTMFVTSLTTASAFYASYISNITAVNCFSIFTGTVVMVNFLLMITWLPASVAATEKWCSFLKNQPWELKLKPARQAIEETWGMLNRFLVITVIKLKYLWLILLGSLSILSAVAIIYSPGLKLPDTRSFQLFHSSHVFEMYDLVYKDNYWFERSSRDWGNGNKMPLRWVWGVVPTDTGNQLDPSSHGSLVMDSSFNISDPQSQLWLFNFCTNLKGQSFYQSTLGALLPNCFIETFVNWMLRRCFDEFDKIDRTPCCETSIFPYNSSVFDLCIVQAITMLYQTPREYSMPGVAGPKFSKAVGSDELPRIAALVVEYESNYTFSMSYEMMEEFYVQIENWTVNQLAVAPPGMKNGFFVSDLEFYDLQKTLSRGTLLAIAVSMGIALGVLLLVTLNILISFYAIITITLSICVTVGLLVIFGWKLNILESLAISTAIGLAVDFSLHIGLAYRRADGSRETRATRALAAAAPPTAMAALTTGVAGALMLPARVLPYTQIGLFLTIVMTVSWIYATFFLGSLLCVAGPAQEFGQFHYPRLKREHSTLSSVASERQSRKTSVAMESNKPLFSTKKGEGHELQHLARANRKPVAHDQSPSAASAITIILPDEGECHK